jgi:hypothetical protein
MGKLIPFPVKNWNNTPEGFIQEACEKILSGEVKAEKIALVVQSSDGYVLTGYYNCGVADKQYLASHIQVDAMWGVVKENRDQL